MTTRQIVTWMQRFGMTTEARHFSRDGKNAENIRKYHRQYQNTCLYCLKVSTGDYCPLHTFEHELERIARTRVNVRVPFRTGRNQRAAKRRKTKDWFMRRIKNGQLQRPNDPYSSDSDSEGNDDSDTDILTSDDEDDDDEPDDEEPPVERKVERKREQKVIDEEPEEPVERKRERKVIELSDDEEPEEPVERKREPIDLSDDDEPSLGLGEGKRERKASNGREEKGEPDEVVDLPRGTNKRARSDTEPRTSRRRRNSVDYTEVPENFDELYD